MNPRKQSAPGITRDTEGEQRKSRPTDTADRRENQDRVTRIRELHSELESLGKTALVKAVEAGRLLREAKGERPHGSWLPWLKSNFSFTDRTARRYISVAQADEEGKLDSVSDLTQAYQLIAIPGLRRVDNLAGLNVVIVGGKKQDPPKTKTPKVNVARGSTLEPAPPPVVDVEIVSDEHVVVVDESRRSHPATQTDKTGWGIARRFIEELDGLSPLMERGGLADMLVHCNRRLKELDNLAERRATR